MSIKRVIVPACAALIAASSTVSAQDNGPAMPRAEPPRHPVTGGNHRCNVDYPRFGSTWDDGVEMHWMGRIFIMWRDRLSGELRTLAMDCDAGWEFDEEHEE